jgi:hypothetical protein
MSCIQCQSINKIIKKPKDLTEAILLAKSKLEDGTLRYLGEGSYGSPFSQIESGKGWSDIVNNYFTCNSCEQIFNLSAETYHGSGGELTAVDSVKGELRGGEKPHNKPFKRTKKSWLGSLRSLF